MRPYLVSLTLAALLATLLAVPLTAPLGAQTLHAGVAGLDARHRLLAPLVGPSAQVEFPVTKGRLRLQVGLDRLEGSQDRIGVPCVGMIDPREDCSPTAMRDAATLTTLGVGPRVLLLRRPRFELSGTMAVLVGSVSANSTAPARDRQFEASKGLFGVDLGACASWQPSRRVPIAATAAASVGRLAPNSFDYVADGYTPFDGLMPYARLQLGLSWR